MRKVLIIEDELNIRETLADLLALRGYEVEEAPDGSAGLEKALNLSPDLILCDINMPGMDGYQVLAELRKRGSLVLVPFIFLTAKSSMDELRTGMELGADDYLIKPFTYETLVRAIAIAEEKKLGLVNQLNHLQNQLNLEKLKIRKIDQVNSHELRRKLSVIQSLFPLIKSGEFALEEGMKVLETSGQDLDRSIHEISHIAQGPGQPDQNDRQQTGLEDVRNIWLIDDDPTQNLLTQMLLSKTCPDWTITTFQEPEIALEQLANKSPDLIFLDINMPGMDGFEFLKRLSDHETNLRVIMLSSSISEADIHRSLGHTHVINYLTKPLKKERIESLLRQKSV